MKFPRWIAADDGKGMSDLAETILIAALIWAAAVWIVWTAAPIPL